jgi:hypothetical protein
MMTLTPHPTSAEPPKHFYCPAARANVSVIGWMDDVSRMSWWLIITIDNLGPDPVVVITITSIIAGDVANLDSPTTGISIYVYKEADGKRSIMN